MSTTITLLEPIKGPRGEVKSITLREPRYGDLMELDRPWVVIKNSETSNWFEQENPAATRAWVERLADCDPNLLLQLSGEDTLAIRDAVYDFLLGAIVRALKRASTGLPASSSLEETGTFVPSTI